MKHGLGTEEPEQKPRNQEAEHPKTRHEARGQEDLTRNGDQAAKGPAAHSRAHQ